MNLHRACDGNAISILRGWVGYLSLESGRMRSAMTSLFFYLRRAVSDVLTQCDWRAVDMRRYCAV